MPEERKSFEQRAQNIILKDRRRLMISGVRHVESLMRTVSFLILSWAFWL